MSVNEVGGVQLCSVVSRVRLLPPHRLYPTRLLCPWDFPGKNTGVAYHFLLQEIFSIQSSDPPKGKSVISPFPLSLFSGWNVAVVAETRMAAGIEAAAHWDWQGNRER